MNAQLREPDADPGIRYIPLSNLRLSPLNARKTGGTNVTDLVASIRAHGLLQNLAVVDAGDGKFDVVAGGRRLRALQQLHVSGDLPDALQSVPCQVISNGEVIEASAAENSVREAMHPADQFEAFKAMLADGKKTVADVAAHFGVAEIVVKQRLKLANVSPKIVALYREGKATLGQLQVLALSDDIKQQEKVWFGSEDWQRSEHQLRQRIVKAEVSTSDARVRFVGLAAYEARGGAVRRDLFDVNQGGFVADIALLDKLVKEKLEQVAAPLVAEGWSWVETHTHLDYSDLSKFGHAGGSPQTRKATPEEQKRQAEIKARLDEIRKAYDRLEEAESFDDDAADALQAESEALEGEAERIRAGLTQWPTSVKEQAGVLVYLADRGLVVDYGRLRPGQSAKKASASSGTKSAGAPAPKKAELSDAMVHRLTTHRTAALQLKVAQDPLTAMRLLAECLLGKLFFSGQASGAVEIVPTNVAAKMDLQVRAGMTDIERSPARAALRQLVEAWQKKGMPTRVGELRGWLFKQDQPALTQLLALATAVTINAEHGSGRKLPAADAIAEEVKLDMADFWQPNAEAFLSLVPKALAIEAVAETRGKAAAAALETLKRDQVVVEAGKQLHGTRWLPKPLRGPGYKAATDKPAASAAAAPAKKAPAKKSPAKAPAKKAAATKPVKKAVAKAVKKAAKKR